MIDDLEDFGGPELDIVERDPKPDNVIHFPPIRPHEKLGETWDRVLLEENRRRERVFRYQSPLGALTDLERKLGQPQLPWPDAWPELGKRARLYTGEVLGIVGPTGGGKTSFALQLAIACRAEGIPVLWNPLELSPAEVNIRIVANMEGVHTSRIRDEASGITKGEWSIAMIASRLAAIEDLWHYVPREGDFDRQMDSWRHAIRVAKRVYRRPPILFVDYIGKLARGAGRDPRFVIADGAEQARVIAEEEECYVAILAQPSRSNNAVLTGKAEISSAADAIGVAGETGEIEHACSVLLGLNVFKADDAEELDAHILVTKARGTGREGRQGYRFCKPGGVWKELDLLPATPTEIEARNKKDQRDKSRAVKPSKEVTRQELNVERRDTAESERRRRIMGALQRAGQDGMTSLELRKTPGTGRTQTMNKTLQDLEREQAIWRSGTDRKWRINARRE